MISIFISWHFATEENLHLLKEFNEQLGSDGCFAFRIPVILMNLSEISPSLKVARLNSNPSSYAVIRLCFALRAA